VRGYDRWMSKQTDRRTELLYKYQGLFESF